MIKSCKYTYMHRMYQLTIHKSTYIKTFWIMTIFGWSFAICSQVSLVYWLTYCFSFKMIYIHKRILCSVFLNNQRLNEGMRKDFGNSTEFHSLRWHEWYWSNIFRIMILWSHNIMMEVEDKAEVNGNWHVSHYRKISPVDELLVTTEHSQVCLHK